MADPARADPGQRRRRWRSVAVAGAAGTLAAGTGLARVLSGYFGQPLERQNALAGVAGMFLTAAGLLVSLAALAVGMLQLRHDAAGSEPATPPGSPVSPGTVSLAAPAGLLDEHILGRDALVADLARMHRRWPPGHSAGRVRVLAGMGGSGKTTVALELDRVLRGRFGGRVRVWWISAATMTGLQSGMRQLAAELGVPGPQIDRAWAGASSAIDLLWKWLDGYQGRWLLVLDNADDPQLLAAAGQPVAAGTGWIRPVASRRGAILITSRRHTAEVWGAWTRVTEVGMLPDLIAAQVLLGHTAAAGTAEQAAALARRLGGLPLGLRLAGRYLADTTCMRLPGVPTTFDGYRDALDAGALPVAVDPGVGDSASAAHARQVVSRTWELSLDLLAERGMPQARTLLRLLALCADTPIPLRLLDPGLLAKSWQFDGLDAPGLYQLLHALAGLGLLTLTPPAGPDSELDPAIQPLHPLVRDTSRHHLTRSNDGDHVASYVALAVDLLHHATQHDDMDSPEDPRSWPAWRTLAPHAAALFTAVIGADHPLSTVEHATAAATLAAQYTAAAGFHRAALIEAARIAAAAAGHLGDEHPATLTIRAALADCTGAAGDLEAARDQFAALLPVRERVSGAEHPDTLAVRADLAQWTGTAGDLAAARDQLVSLLPIVEKVSGTQHLDTLTVRLNLAFCTGASGDMDEARDQYAALLPVMEEASGTRHPATVAARANLAYTTGLAGAPAAARDQYAALLPVQEQVSGAEHPDTLTFRADLARWTGEAGDPATARDQLAALLPVQIRVSGVAHSDTDAVRIQLDHWTQRAATHIAGPTLPPVPSTQARGPQRWSEKTDVRRLWPRLERWRRH